MRLRADRERCCGSGMCALTAPRLFDQDEETGLVVLLDPAPPPGDHEAARLAILACPSGAITESEPT
jgi:ferredoxin